MQHSWRWILLLALAVIGAVTTTQDATITDGLSINNNFEYVELCSGEQATAFYISLHGYQRQLDKLAGVEDGDALVEWYESYDDWFSKNWKSSFNDSYCHGIEYLVLMLSPYTAYSAIEGMIGEFGSKPAQDVMQTLLEMAAADFTTMAKDEFSESDLEINRMITDLPLCSDEQAIRFYDTVEEYFGKANQVVRLNSLHSLKRWLVIYRSWHGKAWEAFYEKPCGGSLMFIHWLESEAYWAGLDQVTVGGNWLHKTVGGYSVKPTTTLRSLKEYQTNSLERK